MKKKWIFIILIILLVSVIGYNYIYQDHRDIKTEQAQFNLSSEDLLNKFSNNTVEAEKKFLNKTIEISGVVTEINKNDLTLNDMVFCQFNSIVNQSIKINSVAKIKGRCIGYDDLLEQVKLDQCTVLK